MARIAQPLTLRDNSVRCTDTWHWIMEKCAMSYSLYNLNFILKNGCTEHALILGVY